MVFSGCFLFSFWRLVGFLYSSNSPYTCKDTFASVIPVRFAQEVAAGQPLEQFLCNEILSPLNLSETFFQVPKNRAGALAALYKREPWHGSSSSSYAVLQYTGILWYITVYLSIYIYIVLYIYIIQYIYTSYIYIYTHHIYIYIHIIYIYIYTHHIYIYMYTSYTYIYIYIYTSYIYIYTHIIYIYIHIYIYTHNIILHLFFFNFLHCYLVAVGPPPLVMESGSGGVLVILLPLSLLLLLYMPQARTGQIGIG